MTSARAASGRRPPARGWAATIAALLVVSLVAPLWSTRMEAPQYRGDEALVVEVYAGRVRGDIQEIATINQYVGVHLPLDTPELHASPWVMAGLAGLAAVTFLLPARWRRPAIAGLLFLMIVTAVGGAGLLQYRLYQMGHVRSDPILEGVPDFTPPLVGTAQIANFTVHMALRSGAWAFVAALVLAAGSLAARGWPDQPQIVAASEPSRTPESRDTTDQSGATTLSSPCGPTGA